MKVEFLEHCEAYWRMYVSVLICLSSIALGLGGIWWAVHRTHCDTDGGRGGAIADAIALFVIFLDRSYASSLYDMISSMTPTEDNSIGPINRSTVREIVVSEIKTLEGLLAVDAKLVRLQSFFLALATLVGTLCWGFGDIWARHYVGKCP